MLNKNSDSMTENLRYCTYTYSLSSEHLLAFPLQDQKAKSISHILSWICNMDRSDNMIFCKVPIHLFNSSNVYQSQKGR